MLTAQSTAAPSAQVSSKRRVRGVALLGLAAFLVLAALWLISSAFTARDELESARSDLRSVASAVAAGDNAGARVSAASARRHANRARKATKGFMWTIASNVPWAGAPLHTVGGLASSVSDLTGTPLDKGIALATTLNPSKLRTAGNQIALKPLADARPAIKALSDAATQAQERVSDLPDSTWASSVDDARASALVYLDELTTALHNADEAAQIMPTMLGAKGVQRYFIGVQNEAEARGTGGLPGAFIIAEAHGGRIAFTHFGNDNELIGVSSGLRFDTDFQNSYSGGDPEDSYQNSNISPHFPYAASIWAGMWQHASGQHIDGAIAIDPTAMSYLLKVSGPTTTSTGERVGADNIVALTQSTAYERFDDQNQRKAFLTDIASAVSVRLLDSKASATQLVKAISKAGDERRILMWSADPSIEDVLRGTRFGGFIPDSSAPFVGLVVVNDGGNKLDYYLERSLQWTRTGCGSTRLEQVSITLTNTAPASGLSPYVTARSDVHDYPIKPGDNRLRVSYFATKGATLQSAMLDGKTIDTIVESEVGHPVFAFDVELPRGQTRQVSLTLNAPAGDGTPVILTQPLVHALDFTSMDESCDAN